MLTVLGGNSASTGYNLTRSLRFRSSASARLTRTFVTPTNQNRWTYSAWVKVSTVVSNIPTLLGADTSASTAIFWGTNGTLQVGWSGGELATSQVFRDPSAWYHIFVAADTTNATAANRLKMYINGSEVTAFSSDGRSGLGSGTLKINSAVPTHIGTNPAAARYYDGYMAEIYFVDGQTLTPSSFGSTNATTGVWQPARYGGTYGNNGFYLPFTDNSALTTSSNVGLGRDYSGNGNYWVTDNISITSGVTYDSMTDVPTLTSATAANFAVLNPLDSGGATTSNANLTWASGGNQGTRSTFFVSTGKWYWEFACTTSNLIAEHGVATQAQAITGGLAYPGGSAASWGFSNNSGNKVYNTTQTNITTAGAINDIVMIALDCDNSKIWFGRNGTWLASGDPAAGTNAAFTSVTGSLSPMVGVGGAASGTFAYNFGQRPFAYTPPTGFVALNTYNLPTSTIVKGNTVMDATLYTGTGASLSVTNTASFKPDLVWVKSRSAATTNKLTDSVRGVTKALGSNSTDAESTDTQGLTAFGSAGFTVGTNTDYNNSGQTYVGWQWQAGQGTNTTNTNGTITSTVSVNASAGFSVVTYTGTGANATVGHGLGVAPSLIICKSRGASTNWGVWHTSLTAYSYFLLLNSTAAQATAANSLQALPTSTLVSLGASSIFNDASTMVMYAWTPIAGYSAFGSYTGNSSTDGPFVYTGFRPKYLLIRRTDAAASWLVFDSARDTYNAATKFLRTNLADAETTSADVALDFLSNGFKLRQTSTNINAGTIIYMAFAENPFRNALAR